MWTVSPVKFTDPPSRSGTEHDWARVAHDLRRRAGQWALLAVDEKVSVATAIRNQKITALQGCEVRIRNTHYDEAGVRRCSIYLRFNEGGM